MPEWIRRWWMAPHEHCYHLKRVTTEADGEHLVMSRTCCKCGKVDSWRHAADYELCRKAVEAK